MDNLKFHELFYFPNWFDYVGVCQRPSSRSCDRTGTRSYTLMCLCAILYFNVLYCPYITSCITSQFPLNTCNLNYSSIFTSCTLRVNFPSNTFSVNYLSIYYIYIFTPYYTTSQFSFKYLSRELFVCILYLHVVLQVTLRVNFSANTCNVNFLSVYYVYILYSKLRNELISPQMLVTKLHFLDSGRS